MRYERDILEEMAEARGRPTWPSVDVAAGMFVEDRSSGFVGTVVSWSRDAVALRGGDGRVRNFVWKPGGFLIDGRPVTLTVPRVERTSTPRVTASGSVAADAPGSAMAKVARASRIWVEGRHDAELVEHVWGDDLRSLGVVVEPMHGADDLPDAVAAFRPGPDRRLGVLLDHLVPGSKESRLAAAVDSPWVLVTGHPFVDVWAGVRPRALGIERWPDVPLGRPWKQGVCDALGVDLAGFWPRLRNAVSTYADLEPELVGAVELLIDHLTA